jgi:large subunit ribosomal protein L22
MRLLADLIRGVTVEKALQMLRYHPKKMYAQKLEKLLLSAVANWEYLYDTSSEGLVVSMISVDSARTLKRIRPAPQGRAHRIRKRFCHVNLQVADTLSEEQEDEELETYEEVEE